MPGELIPLLKHRRERSHKLALKLWAQAPGRDGSTGQSDCLSLIAAEQGQIVGHVAFSPVSTAAGHSGTGLAPLAVAPGQRRQGIGAQLVQAGLEAACHKGHSWAVVLGDPDYYGRFGFQPAPGLGLSDAYGSGDAFQVIELLPGGIPVGAGLVRYAPEFALVA